MDNFNWKNLFTFTRVERKRIVSLLIVIGVLIIIQIIINTNYFEKKETLKIDFISPDPTVIPEIKKQISKKTNSLFVFDPNTISKEEFESIGFSEKQSNMLLKYRKTGAVFKSKLDFKKLYFVNDSIFNRLSLYIKIYKIENSSVEVKNIDKTKYKQTPKRNKKSIRFKEVEINSLTIESIDTLFRYNSYLAIRLIKYKNILGGFFDTKQFNEIYNWDSSIFQKNHIFVRIDTNKINKLDLNTMTIKEIVKHPYITWNMAKIIIESRKKQGKFTSKIELIKRKLINREIFCKLAPYIK